MAGFVRRTVILEPRLDGCVREAWAELLRRGYEATYSMALNFMLVGHYAQATLPEGLDRGARDTMWGFAADAITTRHLNIQDHLARLADLMREAEPLPVRHSSAR
ncbi:MAG: hypothetical protein ACYDEA_04230 [Candidatus Dormibacteria bacterium]